MASMENPGCSKRYRQGCEGAVGMIIFQHALAPPLLADSRQVPANALVFLRLGARIEGRAVPGKDNESDEVTLRCTVSIATSRESADSRHGPSIRPPAPVFQQILVNSSSS